MENENEIWKDISGYEGIYRVSNLGRVKSLERFDSNNHLVKEKIKKLDKLKNGYLRIELWKNGKVVRFLVHRLVAQTFIPNPEKFPQVNHKDENKQNNCVNNLEWCSASYNTKYGTCIERMIKTHNERKTSQAETPVIATDLETGEEIWIKSQNEAARKLNLNVSSIHYCLKGKCKRTSHYAFRHAEGEQKMEQHHKGIVPLF